MFGRFIIKQWYTIFLFIVLLLFTPPTEYMAMYKNVVVILFAISVLHLRYQITKIQVDSNGNSSNANPSALEHNQEPSEPGDHVVPRNN